MYVVIRKLRAPDPQGREQIHMVIDAECVSDAVELAQLKGEMLDIREADTSKLLQLSQNIWTHAALYRFVWMPVLVRDYGVETT